MVDGFNINANMNNKTSSPVVLRVFSSDADAHIALGMLRTNGINCVLENEINASVFAVPTASYCGIKLLVNSSDIEEATRLLEESGD